MDEFTTATGCHLTVAPHEPTGHTLLLLRMDDGRRAEVVLDPAAYAWLRSAPPAPPADLIEKVTKALDPHWRSDCSDGEGRRSWRWVRCRCGWESEKSETLVNMPDLRAIWNEHIARAVLGALDLPGLLNAAKAEALREAADEVKSIRTGYSAPTIRSLTSIKKWLRERWPSGARTPGTRTTATATATASSPCWTPWTLRRPHPLQAWLQRIRDRRR